MSNHPQGADGELEAILVAAFKDSTNVNIHGDAKYWSGSGEYNAEAMTKFFPQNWFDEKLLPNFRKHLIKEHHKPQPMDDELLFDLDEIDNKPWRVFRQLAVIMPEYADTYRRYEAFYAYGGGNKVMELIEAFEKTDDFKESGFPEMISKAKEHSSE